MQLNQLPRDGQAQSQAAVASAGRSIALKKSLEDIGKQLRINSLAVIDHPDFSLRFDACQRD